MTYVAFGLLGLWAACAAGVALAVYRAREWRRRAERRLLALADERREA